MLKENRKLKRKIYFSTKNPVTKEAKPFTASLLSAFLLAVYLHSTPESCTSKVTFSYQGVDVSAVCLSTDARTSAVTVTYPP